MMKCLLFIVLLLAVITTTGCIGPEDEQTQIPTTTPSMGDPQFKPGDIVVSDSTDHYGFLIVTSSQSRYTVDVLTRKDDGSWGQRLYPDHDWVPRSDMEDGKSFVIAHILPSQIKNDYPSEAAYKYANPGYGG